MDNWNVGALDEQTKDIKKDVLSSKLKVVLTSYRRSSEIRREISNLHIKLAALQNEQRSVGTKHMELMNDLKKTGLVDLNKVYIIGTTAMQFYKDRYDNLEMKTYEVCNL